LTAHVHISGYGKTTRTVCVPCGHDAEYGNDHRSAALVAAEHNRLHHTVAAA
jgi:hypothetical protein